MTEIHPRHEDARRAMADRLSHFLYDNHQPSFLVEKAGERYWTEFVRPIVQSG